MLPQDGAGRDVGTARLRSHRLNEPLTNTMHQAGLVRAANKSICGANMKCPTSRGKGCACTDSPPYRRADRWPNPWNAPQEKTGVAKLAKRGRVPHPSLPHLFDIRENIDVAELRSGDQSIRQTLPSPINRMTASPFLARSACGHPQYFSRIRWRRQTAALVPLAPSAGNARGGAAASYRRCPRPNAPDPSLGRGAMSVKKGRGFQHIRRERRQLHCHTQCRRQS